MRGGALYQGKLDGWRALAFIDDRVVIQMRSGGIETARFPDLIPVLSVLPAGTVLDGEIVAIRQGEPDRRAVSFTPATRRATGAVLYYIAFDQLCKDGEDIRSLTLARRWGHLRLTLRNAGAFGPGATRPGRLQLVPATRDRATAAAWLAGNTPIIEGLVIKSLSSKYRPSTSAWVKIRNSGTEDADVIGAVGHPGGPQALRVRLENGRERTTEPLTDEQIRELARAVDERGPGSGRLRVELLTDAGPRGRCVFVRVRPDE